MRTFIVLLFAVLSATGADLPGLDQITSYLQSSIANSNSTWATTAQLAASTNGLWLGLHNNADKAAFATDVSTNSIPAASVTNAGNLIYSNASSVALTAQLVNATNNLNASVLTVGTVPTARLDTLQNQYPAALTNADPTRVLTFGQAPQFTNGIGFTMSGASVFLTNIVYTNVTLDFASTATLSFSDLKVNIANLKSNDVATINPPAISQTNGIFSAWISNTTAYVRFHNYTASAINPASGIFNLQVFQYK